MPAVQSRSYVLGLLTLVYVFNFVDRQILAILGPAIIADLGLTDGQFGLLTGFYFAFFYTALGLPIAWLADRMDRVTIVCIALAVWSGFTVLTSLVQSFAVLVLLRIGVAIGEAGGSPPSHSILSSLYAPRERGRALGIYALGIPLGGMTAYFIAAAMASGGTIDWRALFVLIGLPGIVLAIVLRLTVKDPPRGVTAGAARPPFFAAMINLLKIRSYLGATLGIGLASFTGYAVASFIVVYAARTYDQPLWLVLTAFGLINGLAYGGGTYLGGVLADRFAARSVAYYALVPAGGLMLSVPFLLLTLWTSHWGIFLLSFSIFILATGIYLGPTFSLAQTLAPPGLRASSSAVMLFLLNLIALGLGPTYTGWISGVLQAGGEGAAPAEALRIALTTLCIASAGGIGAYLWTAKCLPQDWTAETGE
ncbi:major facilitator family transporter [Parvularcula bermudensis HTCC2503]|uniref:Major facilitator family transporter n=1 Tax=Parvularcula bermudensis (strain ATCC BAA-594 / HTCC2503 / KCTC 12087) TaxID=314260 RepID=E0TBF4_PARBH|nr:MFS transporter [Parvularcula bermudensis]ADM09751.1 major facilitator family transporter [Parvularcula bermudensis HTCC2503]